jgi:hypothetical protein
MFPKGVVPGTDNLSYPDPTASAVPRKAMCTSADSDWDASWHGIMMDKSLSTESTLATAFARPLLQDLPQPFPAPLSTTCTPSTPPAWPGPGSPPPPKAILLLEDPTTASRRRRGSSTCTGAMPTLVMGVRGQR